MTAIREIQNGRTYVNLQVGDGRWNITPIPFIPNNRGKCDSNEIPLSQREREVLLLVAQGFTNHEIAAQLSIGIKSVETYRFRLMEKLNLHSRAELVQFVMHRRMLSPPGKMLHG